MTIDYTWEHDARHILSPYLQPCWSKLTLLKGQPFVRRQISVHSIHLADIISC